MIKRRKNALKLEKREKVRFIICSKLPTLVISEILTTVIKQVKMESTINHEEVNLIMEKKSTKIVYFVALGVFIVLLVILGIAYKGAPLPTLEVDGEMIETTTPFAGTFWSLLPPIVAIVLALISKEVYSSLFLGCLVGALLVSNFHPWETVVQLVEGDNGIVTTVADGGNIAIVMFLVILGIMVDLMNKAGGSEAFGRWAKKAVK